MQQRLSFLWLKIRLSLRTTGWLLTNWRYSLLAVAVGFVFFELIYWLFNLNVLGVVLWSTKLSIIDKLQVLIDPIFSLADFIGAGAATILLLLSLLHGINIALLSYTIRHQPKLDGGAVGGSAFVSLLAAIGLGCTACGTSLIAPVVAIFVSAGSAVSVSDTIGRIALPVGLAAAIFGLYALGIKAANVRALTKESVGATALRVGA